MPELMQMEALMHGPVCGDSAPKSREPFAKIFPFIMIIFLFYAKFRIK